MWKFQGLIKKELEFLGVLMKKSCEFPWILVFDLETSKGCHTILRNFLLVKVDGFQLLYCYQVKKQNKIVSECNSVATKTSIGALPSLLEVLQKASNSLRTSSLSKLMTVSQNGRYVKLKIMGWNGIWNVPLFLLKIFLQSIFTCPISLPK